MPQIIDVPGVGEVEFPDGMSDDDIVRAIKNASMKPDPRPAEERPALLNQNLVRQGDKGRANMTPPTSIMDPRYPEWARAQDQAKATDAIAGALMPALGAAMAPMAGMVRGSAQALMRSAIKPSTVEDPTKVARAVDTALNRGLNMDAIRERGGELSAQVNALLKQNPGAIPADRLATYGDDLIGRLRYTNQVDDLAAARATKQKFLTGETFSDLGQRERELTQQVLERNASAQGALQDAGRFATQRAQMENAGQRWYPVEGLPRAPYRYSPHAERVPEASGAFNDALVIAKQRQREAELARRQLESLPAYEREGMIPLEQAQAMKQALYAKLGDKSYGLGLKPVAERDMNKSIAHGLRTDIEAIEPGVIPLNAEAAELWNLHNIAGRGVAAPQNKNPLGLNLGLAVHQPLGAAAFALDRSQLAKAWLAQAIYKGQRVPGALAGGGVGMLMQQDEPPFRGALSGY